MPSKRCANCLYGRLVCRKDRRDDLVGCALFRGDEGTLLNQLRASNYVSPASIIQTGWIYVYLPFGADRRAYDTADAGVIAGSHLVSPKEAYCNNFKERR